MRPSFSYQFYCRKAKQNKQGLSPIELCLVISGQRATIQLQFKCSPDLFNRKRKPQEIERYLDSQRLKLNNIMVEMAEKGIPLTAQALKTFFQYGCVKPYTTEDLFNDFLRIKKLNIGESITEGVYKKYTYVRNLFFQEFDKEKDCNSITNNVVRLFFAKIDKRFQNSTASGYKTKFKSFVRFGLDNAKIKINPLQGIKIIREKKPITFLTNEEIRRLKEVKVNNECLQRVKDCAIFQISSGIAYSDCVALEKDDLKEKKGTYYISKQRNKTGNTFISVVLPDGVEIWKKYGGQLPWISNQKYNLFLKALGQHAGITKNLHTHLFRHTYATNLVNSGVSIKTVSLTIGDTLKVCDTFYAHMKEQTVLDEVSKIL